VCSSLLNWIPGLYIVGYYKLLFNLVSGFMLCLNLPPTVRLHAVCQLWDSQKGKTNSIVVAVNVKLFFASLVEVVDVMAAFPFHAWRAGTMVELPDATKAILPPQVEPIQGWIHTGHGADSRPLARPET
jgi:hypothetical protein